MVSGLLATSSALLQYTTVFPRLCTCTLQPVVLTTWSSLTPQILPGTYSSTNFQPQLSTQPSSPILCRLGQWTSKWIRAQGLPFKIILKISSLILASVILAFALSPSSDNTSSFSSMVDVHLFADCVPILDGLPTSGPPYLPNSFNVIWPRPNIICGQ